MSWLQEPFDLLYRPFVGGQYPSGKKQGNVGGKNFSAVCAQISFPPLIRPFSALTWTSNVCSWLDIIETVPRKCLRDLFSLVVFGAYTQVLELLKSMTTEVTPFLF